MLLYSKPLSAGRNSASSRSGAGKDVYDEPSPGSGGGDRPVTCWTVEAGGYIADEEQKKGLALVTCAIHM